MSLETPKSRVGLSPILVIEDNEDHLELTREALQEAGLRHPLQVAASLREVRGLLAQYALRPAAARPCLVLLDLRLPDGSGMEALREIRQRAGWRTVPVVMLTSSADTPDMTKAALLGASGYLVKPVQAEDLLALETGLTWDVSPTGEEGV